MNMKRILLFLLLMAMILPAQADELPLPDAHPTPVPLSAQITSDGLLTITHIRTLRDQNVPDFLAEIKGLTGVKVLDMRSVRMSTEAMVAVHEGLEGITLQCMVPMGENDPVDSTLTDLNLDALKGRIYYTHFMGALQVMTGLTHVTMYNHSFKIPQMEDILAKYPHIAFDWTIHLDNYKIRTDSTAFSTWKGTQEPRYTAEDLDVLKYCKNLLALDVGHNNVYDLSFIPRYWPKLRWLICIGSKRKLTDISPLAGLEDLEYLELFTQNITDISALANKKKLTDLNLVLNDITDLTPLHSCTSLQRVFISLNRHLPQEQIDALQRALPNCRINYTVDHPTGDYWRVGSHYETMIEAFTSRTYIPLP